MELSVVVPTYRRPRLLRLCLQSLVRQDLDRSRYEIVVVDDGSGDETTSVLSEFPDVVAVRQSRNAGPAAARNAGIRRAGGPLLVLVDDDIVASPDLLRVHLEMHDQARDPYLAVLGRVDWHPSLPVTPFMQWLDRSGLQFAYTTWLREGSVDPPYAAFYTANLSLPRALVLDAGGFDERFRYAAYEDMELAFRLHAHGLRMVYRPRAQAWTTRPIDLATFRRRMHRVGESASLVHRIAPDFPLDDAELRRHRQRRRRRLLLRATAPIGRRDAYYWAEVAAAYAAGRSAST